MCMNPPMKPHWDRPKSSFASLKSHGWKVLFNGLLWEKNTVPTGKNELKSTITVTLQARARHDHSSYKSKNWQHELDAQALFKLTDKRNQLTAMQHECSVLYKFNNGMFGSLLHRSIPIAAQFTDTKHWINTRPLINTTVSRWVLQFWASGWGVGLTWLTAHWFTPAQRLVYWIFGSQHSLSSVISSSVFLRGSSSRCGCGCLAGSAALGFVTSSSAASHHQRG
jgi:hypothetical protein